MVSTYLYLTSRTGLAPATAALTGRNATSCVTETMGLARLERALTNTVFETAPSPVREHRPDGSGKSCTCVVNALQHEVLSLAPSTSWVPTL
jgi:hypothetical protein